MFEKIPSLKLSLKKDFFFFFSIRPQIHILGSYPFWMMN